MVVTARRSLAGFLHPAWRGVPYPGVVFVLALVASRQAPWRFREAAELLASATGGLALVLLVVAVVGTSARVVRDRCLTFR
jgi:hypothetical protein